MLVEMTDADKPEEILLLMAWAIRARLFPEVSMLAVAWPSMSNCRVPDGTNDASSAEA